MAKADDPSKQLAEQFKAISDMPTVRLAEHLREFASLGDSIAKQWPSPQTLGQVGPLPAQTVRVHHPCL